MKFRFTALAAITLALGTAAYAQDTGNPTPPAQTPSQAPAPGPGMGGGTGGGRGWGGGFMGGRGIIGTVTEAGSDHFTIKTELGDNYTVNFSPNTRMFKQPAQPMQRMNQPGAMRVPPQEIKSGDIKVGDAIGAMGDVDPANKSIGALTVIKIDPERARQMREMQANFGKTWLMGKITAVNETKITLQSQVDNAEHTFVADENTSFRRRREPVTLADLQAGENVRVEGAVKDGVFTASVVTVMGPPATGGPAPRSGPPPQ